MAGVDERERLERFAQAHFVRKDAAEFVLAEELQPGHALPLVRTQHLFERAERRARELRLATLSRRAIAPAGRCLHLPAGLLAQRGIEETRLHVAEAIACRVLLRRAVTQDLVEFLQRARVNQRDAAVLQPRRGVTGQDETLDVRR